MKRYFHRIINPSLSPNTESEDVMQALRTIITPWTWFHGKDLPEVKQWFQRHFAGTNVCLFQSGRSAFLAILHAFGIGKGDEVIVQAFTCVAVPNSVLWSGATPVYADIDASYNLDPESLEQHITKRTRAILVQHTFGIPADMDAILEIAHSHHLLVIEDCAHAFGGEYNGRKLGTLADASFFSFGRDKALSSVWGGAAIIHAKHKVPGAKLKHHHATLPMPGMYWIFQQLLHPIVFCVILPLYTLGVGKLILVILQKLRILSFPVYSEEKRGGRPEGFPAQYPNALAALLVLQLRKLEQFTGNRQMIAKMYTDALAGNRMLLGSPACVRGASYVRYPILVQEPDRLREAAKRRGILLGNWYHHVIDPIGVDFAAVGYRIGSCPNAEKAAQYIINLPTRIRAPEAAEVLVLFHAL